jgi:hypothetical protein
MARFRPLAPRKADSYSLSVPGIRAATKGRESTVFWILIAGGLWLLSGVVGFITILLGAWRYGRRERLEITSRPPSPGGLRAPRASAASSAREVA